MKIEIKRENGYWLVNGKSLNECNAAELDFMNQFFAQFKQFTTKING